MENTLLQSLTPSGIYGLYKEKRCKWCYNLVINLHNDKEVADRRQFCCEDCRLEYKDWAYVQSYRREKATLTIRNQKNKEKAQEYARQYFIKNRDIIKEKQKSYVERAKEHLKAIRDSYQQSVVAK